MTAVRRMEEKRRNALTVNPSLLDLKSGMMTMRDIRWKCMSFARNHVCSRHWRATTTTAFVSHISCILPAVSYDVTGVDPVGQEKQICPPVFLAIVDHWINHLVPPGTGAKEGQKEGQRDRDHEGWQQSHQAGQHEGWQVEQLCLSLCHFPCYIRRQHATGG